MSSGYLLRQTQARAAASAAPCERCGHPHAEHHEYGYTRELRGGELVEVRDPRHEPGLFRCEHDDCDCEVRS